MKKIDNIHYIRKYDRFCSMQHYYYQIDGEMFGGTLTTKSWDALYTSCYKYLSTGLPDKRNLQILLFNIYLGLWEFDENYMWETCVENE